jgi:LEA14-like dessication related protein
MDNIIEPNENFDFSKLSLAHPIGVQGGAYFTKIEYNKKPLYIQTLKGQTKQGFVKTGKKYYCDLMFDKNAETLVNWFENLEERCRKLIYEKRDAWFQNSLEENDIEAAFNSIIRIYKSGKYYLVRTGVKNDNNGLPAIKIYNENEIPLTIEDIKAETNIISILEIQGIKFTSRNFQIDIELKQTMALSCEPVFNSCLIKKDKKEPIVKPLEKINEAIQNVIILEKNESNDSLEEIEEFTPEVTSEFIKEPQKVEEEIEEKPQEITLEFEELDQDIDDNNEIKELNNNDFNLEGSLETMKLKKPNEVYYELYKEARKKAKLAKKSAIIAYLEAKNIKKTYLIENLDDSDSEFDAEIDEVSESELEDFE